MNLLIILMQAFGFIILIFLWNKYIVPLVIGVLVNFHRTYNSKNIYRQPIKFVIDYQSQIIFVMRVFYWLACALIVYGILRS